MRRRGWLLVVLAALVAWIALAVTRQHLTIARAERSLGIRPHGSFRGAVAPGEPTVSVPMVPLLLNPFQGHPSAYVMNGDLPGAAIQY